MTNNTEQQAVPVAQEAVTVAVTQADRDAVQAFHHVMLLRLMSDVKSQRPKLGDDEGDAGTLVQAFARHRLAARPDATQTREAEGEQFAKIAECSFDDRPRSRVGHPSQMDWEDGYRDGTRAAAAAIRAALNARGGA